MNKEKFLKKIAPLFWFLPEKSVEKEDKHAVIHQVLALGTLEEIKELFQVYDKKTIRAEFLKPKPGLYSPEILEFILFLLNKPQIDKKKYLKTLHGAPSRNFR